MVYTFKFSISNVEKEEARKSLLDTLTYSIEGLKDVYIEDQMINLITKDNQEEELTKILPDLINDVLDKRFLTPKILKESVGTSFLQYDYHINAFKVKGLRVYNEVAIKLQNALDEKLKKLALEHKAKQRKYGSLIPIKSLEKCNYIRLFPQNVYSVTEFPHQLEVLERIRGGENISDHMRSTKFVLSPAVCFHTYEELSNESLAEPLVLTANGNCFRHEADWRLNSYRNNEFNMREIIYVGEKDFVNRIRGSLIDQVWDFFCELGLQGRVISASDPFFFPEDVEKKQYQLFSKMKYELEIKAHNKNYAIASFNNVFDTLCREFNIRGVDGDFLHSGCVAFGLDRWVVTLISVYGNELDRWPEAIRNALNLNTD